jgi:hypothetical protein
VSENKTVAMIRRSRPAKATQTYLREMLAFRDHAEQMLEGGVMHSLPKGSVKSRLEGYGVEEAPMTPEERQDWQQIRDAAQAEVDWARSQLPRTRIKGR